MPTVSLERVRTYPPNWEAMPLVASAVDTLVMLGTTEDGTFSVSVTEEEPVSVPPTKVLQVTVHRPEVALGICAASASPGVHDTDAPTLVAIVPEALPKA